MLRSVTASNRHGCALLSQWGSCVSQSHDDRPVHTAHTPCWVALAAAACHNNSSRTSYAMSERDVHTRHKYPTSDVHPCMRNRTHAPTAKSARPATRFAPATRYIGPQHNPGAKVDTFVRDACKCSLRRDACFESTSRPANARREHTAAGNAPQHPPSTGRMLATPESVEPVETIIYHAGTERGSHARGFRPKEDPSCSQAGGGFRRKEDRMHERVSSGAHA